MHRNIRPLERLVRLVLGLLALALALFRPSVLTDPLIVIGLLLAVTGGSGYSLVYAMVGSSSQTPHTS